MTGTGCIPTSEASEDIFMLGKTRNIVWKFLKCGKTDRDSLINYNRVWE
jgi:hypothetical protein